MMEATERVMWRIHGTVAQTIFPVSDALAAPENPVDALAYQTMTQIQPLPPGEGTDWNVTSASKAPADKTTAFHQLGRMLPQRARELSERWSRQARAMVTMTGDRARCGPASAASNSWRPSRPR